MPVGMPVGLSVDVLVGVLVGVPVGMPVGLPVGMPVGLSVGVLVGVLVGVMVGVPFIVLHNKFGHSQFSRCQVMQLGFSVSRPLLKKICLPEMLRENASELSRNFLLLQICLIKICCNAIDCKPVQLCT
jgi:hypothetical protein